MREVKPTQKPVPSSDIKDLFFNSGKLDEVVTSKEDHYVDRFGEKHRTMEGIGNLAKQAMVNYGYITKRSFESGNTIINPNDVLLWENIGRYYRWDGALPKEVPAGSTPESAGGVKYGSWVDIGDATSLAEVRKHEESRDAHEELFTELKSDIHNVDIASMNRINVHNSDIGAHPELNSHLAAEVERIDNALNDFMQTQLGSGRIFSTIQDGLSGSVSGQHFLVKGVSPSFADMYLNNGGSAKFINSMSDISAVQGVNIFPDPTFNIFKENNGYLNGNNVFRTMQYRPSFLNGNVGLYTGSVMRVEKIPLSITLIKSDLVLLQGKKLFLKSLISSSEQVTFSVHFKNGSSDFMSKSYKTVNTLEHEVVVSIDVPANAEYDTIEVRYTPDNVANAFIEVGYLVAGYGSAPSTVNKSEFINKKPSVNMLWDASNEISSKTPITADYSYYETLGAAKLRFKNDPNGYCGENSLYVKGNRINKKYDLRHIHFNAGDRLNFSCKAYSTGTAKIHIQFFKSDGSALQTNVKDIKHGNNQVAISDTLVGSDILLFKIAIIPDDLSVDVYVNDFYLGYDQGFNHGSADVPVSFRDSSNPSLTANLIPDNVNQLSFSTIGNKWFSGKFTLLENGESGLKHVAQITGAGRLKKSYDISDLGIRNGDVVTVGATTFVNNLTSTPPKIYAQFTKGGSILSAPQKVLIDGIDKTLMQWRMEGEPDTLNFLVDVYDNETSVEITDFYLGLKNQRNGGVLPVSVLESIIGATNPTDNSILPQINNNALINYHIKSTKLLLGEGQQISMAFIGDSWTHAADRYCGPLTSLLAKENGDAGSGWIGFGMLKSGDWIGVNGNARPSLYRLSFSDVSKWNLSNDMYYKSASPDLCSASSNMAGAKLTVTGTEPISYAKLFYMKTSGQFKYRFGTSEWVTIDASTGSELNIISLSGIPSSSDWSFELEVVSGTVTVCGIDTRNSSAWNGIITHKLGATGSHSRHWAEISETSFVNAIKSLGLDSAFILLGTNDQAALSPAEFEANLRVIIQRLKKANSNIDVVLVCPCENLRSNTTPMSDYSQKMRNIANETGCGFIDLQTVFGVNPQSYGSASDRPLFNSDGIHPEPMTGGRAIVSSLFRFVKA